MKSRLTLLDVVELRERRGAWPVGTTGTIVELFPTEALVEITDDDGKTVELLSVPYETLEGAPSSAAPFDPATVVGYSVEARDGTIGKIDEAAAETVGGFLIVDTGPWIFGRKVMLPASVVDRVDADAEIVYVSRTKEQIKNAPEFEGELVGDTGYHDTLTGYYDAELAPYTAGAQGYADPPLAVEDPPGHSSSSTEAPAEK